jgi:hypothetical protein
MTRYIGIPGKAGMKISVIVNDTGQRNVGYGSVILRETTQSGTDSAKFFIWFLSDNSNK